MVGLSKAVENLSNVRIKESDAEDPVWKMETQKKKMQSEVMQRETIRNQAAENQTVQTAEIRYHYAGYQVHVSFAGERTLKQCIQNLTERKMTDPEMGEPEKAEHGKGLRVQADGRAD